MGDDFSSFEPAFPDNWKMPPGYEVTGITDPSGTFYHWFYSGPDGEWRFGPNCRNKTLARRGAFADYRGAAQ